MTGPPPTLRFRRRCAIKPRSALDLALTTLEDIVDPKALVSEARSYLLQMPGVTEEILNAHLQLWSRLKKGTIEELFRSMLTHAQNRQGMPNAIGNIDNLSDVLCAFSPARVVDSYETWELLLGAIQSSGVQVPGRIDPANRKSYWVIYAQSILSCARFISSFNSVESFHKFVEGFYFNEHSKLALPLLIKEEVFGFGFALACDFLKENGYSEFVKPDTHINDITRALHITQANTDFGVFKDVVAYCQNNGLVPYELDKLLWLVGSGSFYLNGLRVRTDKWAFIAQVQNRGCKRGVE